MALSEVPADPASGLCETIAWQAGAQPVHAVEGNIRSSGATLAWLARLTSATPGRLAQIAAGARADGVHLVPGFNGLGAPWWDPDATGLLTGLTLGTSLENVARAALESVAFQINDLLIAIREATGGSGVLSVDGGAAANSTLMQLQADISGIPVQRPAAADLSALGAAHLTGLARPVDRRGPGRAAAGAGGHPGRVRPVARPRSGLMARGGPPRALPAR